MMRSARALLWEACVTQIDAESGPYLSWDIHVLDEDAAQNWLPIARTAGNRFTDDFYFVRSDEVKAATDTIAQKAVFSGQTSYQQEFPIPLADGSLRWLREDVQVRPLAEKCWELVGVCVDVTERRHSENALAYRAHHDELTGLPNRLSLLQRLDALLTTSSESPVLLFLDLDNFKTINDSLGHLVGDTALAMVARRLRDALPKEVEFLRLGGDEFTLLLPQGTSQEAVQQTVQLVLETLKSPLLLERRTFFISASIGITYGPATSASELLRQADSAMYHAKKQGSGRFAFFDPQLENRARTRLVLEHELRRALEIGEITPYYQPILALGNHKPLMMEALARWQHPERGLISPGDFFPLAEETGLILPLGEHLLRTACESASAWRRQGISVGVCQNISAFQLHDPAFCDKLKEILQKSQLEPSALTLEISESILMTDFDRHFALLNTLARMGIRFAIDDFGAGFSSLAYLSQLPIHSLKVDRRFVRQLQDPSTVSTGQTIIRTIVALAHAQERSVTAVGIETDSQLSYLKRLGADHGQGFYLARPLSLTEALRFLQACAARTRRAA